MTTENVSASNLSIPFRQNGKKLPGSTQTGSGAGVFNVLFTCVTVVGIVDSRVACLMVEETLHFFMFVNWLLTLTFHHEGESSL